MKHTIISKTLQVQVDDFGAELKSIQKNGREYLWQGDPAIWSDSAPFLFPVVARQLGDGYDLNGVHYDMPMHGFAKSRRFTLISKEEDSLCLRLLPDEETLHWYPFQFTVDSLFQVQDNVLSVTRRVENRGEVSMPFALGEHPGYCIASADCGAYLRFSQRETAPRWVLDDEIIDHSEPYLDSDTIAVTPELFERGALIFKHLSSDCICLHHPDGAQVQVSLSGWDYLGIWAKPNAPYVCIEPWTGHASCKAEPPELTQREGFRILPPHTAQSFTMQVKII